jgi:hypothetical protein
MTNLLREEGGMDGWRDELSKAYKNEHKATVVRMET